MTNSQRINAVATSLEPVLSFLVDYYGNLVGAGRTGVVLLLSVDDQVQFASNLERASSVEVLQDLLARWSLGLPDTMPGEATPGDTRPFEYLLNRLEAAHDAPDPAAAGYPQARTEVLAYVGRLVAMNNRAKVP